MELLSAAVVSDNDLVGLAATAEPGKIEPALEAQAFGRASEAAAGIDELIVVNLFRLRQLGYRAYGV